MKWVFWILFILFIIVMASTQSTTFVGQNGDGSNCAASDSQC